MRKPILAALAALMLVPTAPAGELPDELFADRFQGIPGPNPPVFAPLEGIGVLLGDTLSSAVEAEDPDPADLVSFSVIAGPDGLMIETQTGLLTWEPDADDLGVHPLTLRATDLGGLFDQVDTSVHVFRPNASPRLVQLADAFIPVNATLNVSTQASDPDPAGGLVFSLDEAPGDASIVPDTGLIEWTPGAPDIGVHEVIVRVTDGLGAFDTMAFRIEVTTANQPPQLAPIGPQAAEPGALFTLSTLATDADLDPLRFTLPQAPSGMGIGESSGNIEWTPAQVQLGMHPVTVRVEDGRGGVAEQGFDLVVAANRPPVAVDDAYSVERGDTLDVPAPGLLANDLDPDFDVLTAVLVDPPIRGSLSLQADGSFQYTPDNPAGTIGFQLAFSTNTASGAQDQPLIGDFDDDGVADILVRTFEELVVSRGDSGATVHALTIDRSLLGGSATADIDLDGLAEFIYIGQENGRSGTETGRKLIALEHDGGLKWVSESLPGRLVDNGSPVSDGQFQNAKLTIADLDADGTPEILVGHGVNRFPVTEGGTGYTVFDHQGRKRYTAWAPGTPSNGDRARIEVVDLDLDGIPEIVTGSAAFTNTGEVLWSLDTSDIPLLVNNRQRSTPIAANLDTDPYPELVRELRNGEILALNHDGSVLWQAVTSPSSNDGSPPLVIADVDNDGLADVLVTDDGNFGPNGALRVLEGLDGSLKWSFSRSGLNLYAGGTTVIDMDRDGFNEVIVFERNRDIIVLDGVDGQVEFEYDSETAEAGVTALPVFADVDGDGHSELVLAGESRFAPNPSVGVWVFESPNDDWPPQRAVFNQWNYHVTNINPDLSVPRSEPAHWLLPGLNLNRINERLPEERLEDRDAFTYLASDGEFESAPATVDLTILPPNNAPRILSEPRRLASPGFAYEYPLLAVDPDVGETLAFSLTEAPGGMTIDSQGLVTWQPDAGDLGDHDVVVQVVDSIGLMDAQAFVLRVVGAVSVPDVRLQAESDARNTLEQAGLQPDSQPVFSDTVPAGLVVDQDPGPEQTVAAGTSVRIDISQGPAPAIVPDVIGLDTSSAESALQAAGLAAGVVTFENRADVPVGVVFTQEPAPSLLAPTGSSVALGVSGGPRVRIELETPVVGAGNTTGLSVTVFDFDGTIADPQPSLTLDVLTDPTTFDGAPPQITGGTLTTSPGSAGPFLVQAEIDGTGETALVEAVVMPPISESGENDDVFSVFSGQLAEFEALVIDLETAIQADDTATIVALDEALGLLRESIDFRSLRATTPLAPEGGAPPDVPTVTAAGFPRQYEDVVYVDALAELFTITRALAEAVAESSTPDSVLFALNQDLVEAVTVLPTRDPTLHGLMESLSLSINLVGSRIPDLVINDIDAVRQALVDAGLIEGERARDARFTLGGLMSATRIRSRVVREIYQPIMADLVKSGVLLAANGLIQEYTNSGSLAGVVTASSQAIHVFGIPNSVVEGTGLDLTLAEGNTVYMIGPDAVSDMLEVFSGGIPQSNNLRGVNDVANLVNEVIKDARERAGKITNIINKANSTPGGLGTGCILSMDPGCGQLYYPNGFASVYQKQGGLQLPSPILILTHNVRDGNLSLFVAPFLPTAESE